jgi:hypothetical protein
MHLQALIPGLLRVDGRDLENSTASSSPSWPQCWKGCAPAEHAHVTVSIFPALTSSPGAVVGIARTLSSVPGWGGKRALRPE